MKISLPYGHGYLSADLPENRINAVIQNHLNEYFPKKSESELVEEALRDPIGSPTLSELSRGKKNIVIIASDHTRPVPSKLLIPPMLREIRKGNPSANISILIATGCHRSTTKAELEQKFGSEILEKEHIVIHDCADSEHMKTIGMLPSGGVLKINSLAAEADLLVSEGFIEPHFFAGFSGGRKSVLPGIASRETVYYNHNSAFIDSPLARCGILDGNPIHTDMIYTARTAKLAYILNVVINSRHEVIHAVSGDCDLAHRAGAKFLEGLCKSSPVPSDIVISTNNGYPLDQNVYQSVKGMSTAEATCLPGGVIIMVAACEEGLGGDSFFRTFRDNPDSADILKKILSTPADKTIPDQWQSQIFARILTKFPVVFLSKEDPEVVRAMHMIPVSSLEEAISCADKLLGRRGSICVIPEGISEIIC